MVKPLRSRRPSASVRDEITIPLEGVTRRAFVATTAGLAIFGCNAPSKWEVERVDSEDGLVELDVKDYPPLATPGGMVALKPSEARKPVVVMALEDNQYRVMSLQCPHLGCTVRWDNDLQLLRCPCHGSQFADDGRVLEGPARDSLRVLRSETIATRVRFRLPES